MIIRSRLYAQRTLLPTHIILCELSPIVCVGENMGIQVQLHTSLLPSGLFNSMSSIILTSRTK